MSVADENRLRVFAPQCCPYRVDRGAGALAPHGMRSRRQHEPPLHEPAVRNGTRRDQCRELPGRTAGTSERAALRMVAPAATTIVRAGSIGSRHHEQTPHYGQRRGVVVIPSCVSRVGRLGRECTQFTPGVEDSAMPPDNNVKGASPEERFQADVRRSNSNVAPASPGDIAGRRRILIVITQSRSPRAKNFVALPEP
jgi:hypothetical protein